MGEILTYTPEQTEKKEAQGISNFDTMFDGVAKAYYWFYKLNSRGGQVNDIEGVTLLRNTRSIGGRPESPQPFVEAKSKESVSSSSLYGLRVNIHRPMEREKYEYNTFEFDCQSSYIDKITDLKASDIPVGE